MYDQAITEYLAFPGPGTSPEKVAQLKGVYAKSGWVGFLRARINDWLERSKKEFVRPFTMASLYARLGQKDEAFAWLEKGYEGRDYQMTELNVRPEMDSLRSDPRFAELVRRVGLPQ